MKRTKIGPPANPTFFYHDGETMETSRLRTSLWAGWYLIEEYNANTGIWSQRSDLPATRRLRESKTWIRLAMLNGR